MLLTVLLACSPAAKPPDADTQDSGDTVETAETGDTSGPLDADGDGVDATEDCDDADPSVTAPSDWYPDEDQDGWGAVVAPRNACHGRNGDVATTGDCDDTEWRVYPEATESCNGRDDDCDGSADEGFDGDADGVTSCAGDCDDVDDTVFPGAPDADDGTGSDPADNDCDGLMDEDSLVAGDVVFTEVMIDPAEVADLQGEWFELYNTSDRAIVLDGFDLAIAAHVVRFAAVGALEPGAYMTFADGSETAVAVDRVCAEFDLVNAADVLTLSAGALVLDTLAWVPNGAITSPHGASLSLDPEFTGVPDPPEGVWCGATSLLPSGRDHGTPDAVNDPCPTYDHDGDGWTGAEGDCDDANVDLHPGAIDTWYDGVDTDCDGWSDFDADHDGVDIPADCDDTNPLISPALPEACLPEGIDDNCNGLIDDEDSELARPPSWFPDLDGDGWGNRDGMQAHCLAPEGFVAYAHDCDDADAAVNPEAVEVCGDEIDNDCDGGFSPCGLSGGLTAGTAAATWLGEAAGDAAGHSFGVAGIGDVNGDGLDDVAIGAAAAASNTGAVYVLAGPFGGSSSLSTYAARWTGEHANGVAGRVAAAGDVDGDGLPDLVIGAPGDDTMGAGTGAVYLVPATATGDFSLTDAIAKRTGVVGLDAAGSALAGAGDVDADGYDDVLVGAPGPDRTSAGAAYLLRGPLTGTTSLADADLRLAGRTGGDLAGTMIVGGDDLDGDGRPDLVIGAPHEDAAGSDAGAVYVVSGEERGYLSLSSVSVRLTGVAAGDGAGLALASIGDSDGDGYGDLVVGAPTADAPSDDSGHVYVILGPITTAAPLSSAAVVLAGGPAYAEAGRTLAAPGDIDADGRSDLLVGMSGADDAGGVWLLYGAFTGVSLQDAPAWFPGVAPGDNVGSSLGGAGDTDGDGYRDILVGGAGVDDAGAEAGAVWLFRGGMGL